MMEHDRISDRRRAMKRRVDERRDSIYRTRREWIIAEFIIGCVSFAAGLTGITPGMVGATLAQTANNMPWFIFFCGSGACFIVSSFAETRCRAHFCPRETLLRYAYFRFGAHVINFFCWVMAFLWFHFSNVTVASIYYEALPIAAANFFALVEHAKALWLKPYMARTTSMTMAGLNYIRGLH